MTAGTTSAYRRDMNKRISTTLATVAIAALAWVDPIYLPLILLGPILTGLIAGAKGAAPRLVAIPWFAAGIVTLVLDLAINGEDMAFHAVVAAFTAAVGAGCAAVAQRMRGRAAVTP